MCELIGAAVQLAVTDSLFLVNKCGGVGCALSLRLEKIMEARIRLET